MRSLALILMLWPFSAAALEVGPDEQTSVDLTVYNDFAVVRDVREMILPTGVLDVEFQSVAKTIDPGSVRVVSVDHENEFEVLEQAYEYDLLNKRSLLQRYIGHKLKYSRSILQGTSYEKILREGILLSIDPEIVKFGDEIEIDPEGVISLPYVPESLQTIPTLTWRVDNDVTGPQVVETTYIADDMGWETDYRATLNPDETRLDLIAWVNITNESGVAYNDARIKVVAGDVRRVAGTPQPMRDAPQRERAMFAAEPTMPEPRSLSEFHVFELPYRVNLYANQVRQVKLMEVSGIDTSKSYVSRSMMQTHRSPQPSETRFDVRLSLDNTDRNRLGMPLPQGRFSVFKPDADGVQQFVGQDRIEGVPEGDTVEVVIGQAFDLLIERTQTDWSRIADDANEVAYEVVVKNYKDEEVELIVQERFTNDWTILSQTAHGRKIDSMTQEYVLELAAGETYTFSYTARVRY